MSINNTMIRVFLASPSRLAPERKAVQEIIERINATIGERLKIKYQLLSWERSVYPDFGDDAQDVINKQINDEYDVFIGLMWDRVGTQTKRSLSGTIEEYERAYNKRRSDCRIVLMMYFKNNKIALDHVDVEQVEKLQNFQKRVSEDGCLYYTYKNLSDFKAMLYDHLNMVLLDYDQRKEKGKAAVKDYLLQSTEANYFAQTKEACAIAIICQKSLLIIKRGMHLRVGCGLWQLPGGKIEAGESPAEAAIRECYEELGIKIDREKIIYLTSVNSNFLGDQASTSIRMHLLAYELDAKNAALKLEPSIDKIKWLPFSEIYAHRNINYLGVTFDLLCIAKRYYYLGLSIDLCLCPSVT